MKMERKQNSAPMRSKHTLYVLDRYFETEQTKSSGQLKQIQDRMELKGKDNLYYTYRWDVGYFDIRTEVGGGVGQWGR